MKAEATKILAARVPASLSKKVRLTALKRDITAADLIRIAVRKEIGEADRRDFDARG